MQFPALSCANAAGSENRIELLDFLRGTGMLLVVVHHSDIPHGVWILLFHMPYLFFLSGYTTFLRSKQPPFFRFLKGRFCRLVIPYFLFEGANLAVWTASLILQGGWQDLSEALTAIVTCVNTEGYTGYYGRLWFWPCMFLSDILFYWIRRLAPREAGFRKAYHFLMIAVLIGISWITTRVLPFRLPFTADTAFMAAAFLLAGYALGKQVTWLLQKSHLLLDLALLVVSLYLMRIAYLDGYAACLMYTNKFGPYPATLCAAFTGIIAWLILSKWLYRLCDGSRFVKSFVLWYGYHSLCTFPAHFSVKMCFFLNVPVHMRQWYYMLPVMLILNIPVVNLITRYFPFMLGKFPAGKSKT